MGLQKFGMENELKNEPMSETPSQSGLRLYEGHLILFYKFLWYLYTLLAWVLMNFGEKNLCRFFRNRIDILSIFLKNIHKYT